jgi:hypothetical protein
MAEEMMRLTLRIVGHALFTLDLDQDVGAIGPSVTTVHASALAIAFP